ncbi:MAG: N-acetyltransferase family protein [Gaiellaceae bacterium]
MIRTATSDDLGTLRALWHEFEREIPAPAYDPTNAAQEEHEIEEIVRDGIALLAERDGEPVGFALANKVSEAVGLLDIIYVRAGARRHGVGRALVHEVAARLRARGAEIVRLEVLATNTAAQAVYERWGFRPEELILVADAGALEQRLGQGEGGRSFGSIHVQTDDRGAVERAVAKFLPRLGRSEGTEISEPRAGWTAVYDELSDRDPKILQRLARELSYASTAVTLAIGIEQGAVVRYTLFDRGGAVDEYLSVPEYYGPLPPGDVVALGANPTVVARLTGADPARVRAIAVTAATPERLPPPEELLRALAAAIGIEGAEHGWVGSRSC